MANFRQIWSHWQSHTHPYCLYFCFDGPLSLSLFYAETLSWFLLSHRTHMQGHKFIRPQKHQNSGLLTLYPILTMRFSLFLSFSLSLSLCTLITSTYSLSLSLVRFSTQHTLTLSLLVAISHAQYFFFFLFIFGVYVYLSGYLSYLPTFSEN